MTVCISLTEIMTNGSATGNAKRPEFRRHEALRRLGRAPHFICCEGQLKTFNGIVRLSSFSAAGLLTLPLSVTAGVICQMGPLTVSHWLSTLIQPRPMKKPVIKWEVWHNSCLMVEKQQPVRWLKAGPTEHKFYLPADAACKRSAWLWLVFYCWRIKRQKRLIICLHCFFARKPHVPHSSRRRARGCHQSSATDRQRGIDTADLWRALFFIYVRPCASLQLFTCKSAGWNNQ